jgi:glucose/arabinose dehydrogenase
MLKKIIAPLSLLCLPLLLVAQPKIQLVDFASGLNGPVDIAHCGDSRLFVVEQDGVIKIVDTLGNVLTQPFMDINPRVNSTGNEQGLLGLAFHPNYAQNGYFFVYYTKNNGGDTRVSRFSVMPDDPNKADPNSELTIIEQDQPFTNHNGGCIKFGPDGYLYIGLGDGGSGGDPQGNGQKKTTFLGKILRIDVNNASPETPYVVPADNPFVGNSAYFPEIWSLGWRNPWRFSFDRLTGDMWVADVGQGDREEIDFEPAATGGRNYGWRCYEGTQAYNTSGCLGASNYTAPIFDYDNSSLGCSVTGGFRYRGSKYPDLYGIYLHTDYCSGRWWATRRNADNTFTATALANLSDYEYSSLGEDNQGELYVAMISSGKIQKIKEICSSFQVAASSINSPVCDGSLSGWVFLDTVGTSGNVNFIWSNGQNEKDIVYLNPGNYSVVVTNGNGCSRTQSFVIENASPAAPILLSGDLVLCGGDSIQLATSDAPFEYGYQWSNNLIPIQDATGQNLTVTEPGIYTVQHITNLGGCNSLRSTEVNVIQDVSLEPEIGLEGDSLFALTPCDNNCQWLLNNEPIPGANGSYHIATQSGTYELEVTTSNGCQRQSGGVEVLITDVATPASVQTFSLSPNPADRSIVLYMELKKTERVTVILQDKQMRQIFSQTQDNQRVNMPIDLNHLPAGTYYLHIQVGNERFVRKVVKV